MLSKVSERSMHSVRMLLVASWLVLIGSMFYDPFSKYLTSATNTFSPFHLNKQAACFPFQAACLQMQPYPLGARVFWGMVVPASVLILVVLGHETWRRICPLSFLSQIPRALGIQRRRRVIDPETQSVRSELVSISQDSWLGRNAIYCQFGLLFAGLNIRLLFANSDRFALGIYLVGTIIAAIAIGYLYAGKTWCHYFCPMGPVQTIYTGTGSLAGSQATQTKGSITQSMCRTTDATGTERSACVSCQSPCMDIDAERAYWEKIDVPGQKLLYYGYVGLVLGFFLYFPLYTGNWNYLSGPVWNETNQIAHLLEPGFYLFDRAIPIPKLLAIPLTLGGFTGISYTVGVNLEKFYRQRTQTTATALIQHRGFTIATFLAFNALFFLGVKPTLSWLPILGRQLVSWLAIIAITLWAYRNWGRSAEQYTRASLASGLRRQLQKLGIDLTRVLEGRSIDDLDADEVYILAKTLPGVDRDRRIEIYQNLVQEAVSSGQVNSATSLVVFKQLRQKLEITEHEHHGILQELGVEDPNLFNPTRLVTVESQMRLSAYRQFLELLLIELVESGTPLQTAMQLKHLQIAALKQEYQITAAEEAQVLAGMGAENSLLVRGLQALVGQLQTLDWRDRSLLDNPQAIPSIQLLQSIVREKQQLVFAQFLGILEILGDSNESRSAVTTVANLYGYGLELIWERLTTTDNWNLRLSPQITDGLTPHRDRLAAPQCLLEIETIATLQSLWQDVEPLTQAASLDAIHQLQPALARSLVQKAIQPHPDKLVQEVMQRVQGTLIQPELTAWTAEIEVNGRRQQVRLQQAQLRIGRADDNDLVLADPNVSRYHAIVRSQDGVVAVQDLGSANGIRIGQKVIHNQSEILQPADVLHFNTWKAQATVALQWQLYSAPSNALQLDTLQKLTWLLRCDFFAGMRLETLIELATSGVVRSYEPGEIVCERGQQAREILVVLSGFASRVDAVADRRSSQLDATGSIDPAASQDFRSSNRNPNQRFAHLESIDLSTASRDLDSANLQTMMRFDEMETIAPNETSPDRSRQQGKILPGQEIGGLQVLTRSPREFTKIAGVDPGTERMTILAIAARDFDAILDRDPTLTKHLLGILSTRLQVMQHHQRPSIN
jgi:CRP-like cAMP-binding protein